MKKYARFFLLIAVMFAIAAPVCEAGTDPGIKYTGPPITMRFSAYYPAVYPVFEYGISKWIPMVESESGGKIVFKTYFNGVLHQAKDGFKAMSSDIADITTGYPAYQPGSFKLCHVTDLPFAFPNAYTAAMVMEQLYPKYFKTEYEKMNVYLAFYTVTSDYNLISKKPVRTFEDLKGMKIRSFGGTCSELLKCLGAIPVTVQAGEVYTSFQRGIIDGALFADNSINSFRLHEVGKYLTSFGLTRMGIPYCMNKKTFDSLPPDLKKFFYNKLRQGCQIASGAYEVSDKTAREEMIKAGVEMIKMDPAEVAKCKAAVQPLWEKFMEENEKQGLPARQLVKDIKALNEKYSTWTPEQFMKQVTEHPVQGIITF